MPFDQTLHNEQVVRALSDAMRSGAHGLDIVPKLVRQVIEDNCWAERTVGADRRRVAYQDFLKFVTDPPLEGLGADIEALARMCADDVEATRLLAEVRVRPVGRPAMADDVRDSDRRAAHGNSTEYALRVLAHQFPDLYEEVRDGRMSAHAAAVRAGIRKRTATVEASPDGIARYVERHFTPEEIAALVARLRPGVEGETALPLAAAAD